MPLPIILYRFFSYLLTPFFWIIILYRSHKGKEDWLRRYERVGKNKIKNNDEEYVWIHAASVGELLSILPLSNLLLEKNYRLLITTTTLTSANIFLSMFSKKIIHQFIPYDSPVFCARFLSNWKIKIGIFVESEIWPNFIIECKRKKIPLIITNARFTQRTFNRWKTYKKSIKYLLNCFEYNIAQNNKTLEWLEELGSTKVLFFGNIKHDAKKLPVNKDKLEKINKSINGRNIIVATSTHKGEEEVIFSFYKQLKQSINNLLLIIAPRHPERSKEINKLSKKYGFSNEENKFLSKDELPDKDTKLFIYDKIGELGQLYSIADYVILGGAFEKLGGHNPIEPAKFGVAIFSGANFFNFEDDYYNLIKSEAAMIYKEDTLLNLILSDNKIDEMGINARKCVEKFGGASEETLKLIERSFANDK